MRISELYIRKEFQNILQYGVPSSRVHIHFIFVNDLSIGIKNTIIIVSLALLVIHLVTILNTRLLSGT